MSAAGPVLDRRTAPPKAVEEVQAGDEVATFPSATETRWFVDAFVEKSPGHDDLGTRSVLVQLGLMPPLCLECRRPRTRRWLLPEGAAAPSRPAGRRKYAGTPVGSDG